MSLHHINQNYNGDTYWLKWIGHGKDHSVNNYIWRAEKQQEKLPKLILGLASEGTVIDTIVRVFAVLVRPHCNKYASCAS